MRGKTKFGKNLLMLSLIVASILTLAIAPASAQVATMSAPDIANPLLDVGSTFSIDILIADVSDLWSFEFTLSYDTSVLTCTAYDFTRSSPVSFVDPLPSGINDAAGYMWMGATRGILAATGEAVGTGDGKTTVFYLANVPVIVDSDTVYLKGVPTTDYTIDYATGEIVFASAPKKKAVITADYEYTSGFSTDYTLPIATVTFKVDSRGTTMLGLGGSALKDPSGNLIPHNTVAGSFNNRLQGVLSAPDIVDNTLTTGLIFSIEVTVAEVENLWGYQFVLSCNEAVLQVRSVEPLSIFTDGEWEVGPGYAAVAYNSYFGDPDGLSTVEPVPIARIEFKVLTLGASMLTLQDTALTNVYGDPLTHETVDGVFVNAVDLAGRGAWPEKKRMTYSLTYKLYAKVQNLVADPIAVKATFTISTLRTGVVLGTIETAVQTIPGGSTVILEADFDTALWGTAPYKVDIKAECGGVKTFSVSVVP